jgi:hypothetical protein
MTVASAPRTGHTSTNVVGHDFWRSSASRFVKINYGSECLSFGLLAATGSQMWSEFSAGVKNTSQICGFGIAVG